MQCKSDIGEYWLPQTRERKREKVGADHTSKLSENLHL
jgi:hypothetical protein